MLTLQMLKDMEPGTIFATGVAQDDENGLFLANTGKLLRWVACRGGIWDWAIYAHFADNTDEWIQNHGDKVHDNRNIKKCIECDDEAFAMYRH